MDMSLMLLEQVALSNSHWSVFNLQDLPGSEELTGTVLKHYLRIDYCGFGPFSSTLTDILILMYLPKIQICIIH